jgi:4-hydroxy-tetrahydrodipicolinate synthase
LKIQLKGIITPIITPYKTNGDLDLKKLRSHIRFLIENGVHGIFALGTAGEFALLSKEERTKVLKTTVDEVNGKVPVLAGVSDPGTRNVIANGKTATDIGVDVIVVTTPYYFHTTEEGLYSHFSTITSKLDIPVVIYNIPSFTGHFISVNLAKRLSEIKNIIAMKYTASDFASFVELVQVVGSKISMLIGSDTLIYSALNIGASGAVVGGSNVFPEQFVRIYDLFQKKDYETSKQVQLGLLPFINVMHIGTFPSALKEALRILGFNMGSVRKPLMPLTKKESNLVRRALKEMDVI